MGSNELEILIFTLSHPIQFTVPLVTVSVVHQSIRIASLWNSPCCPESFYLQFIFLIIFYVWDALSLIAYLPCL